MAVHAARTMAAAQGDDVALAEVVRAYHQRVHRFGLRACRDAFDAEDAVQEAFAQLARRPAIARDAGVVSWLLTVVKNACLRLLRPFARRRRLLGERVELEETSADGPPADVALERYELVRAVHEAIAGLDAGERDVLVLRDLEGMTGRETAQALGISEAAMKSRLHRARGSVRTFVLAQRAR
jgi:RNA polymerase sigma-70 factor, ECF subfamily